MESYTFDSFDKNEKPDETGESEASKKKKKKPIKAPLPVKRSGAAEREVDKAKQGLEQSLLPGYEPKEKEESKGKDGLEAEQLDEKLSEAEEDYKEESEYLGELVIDHSDDQEELELPVAEETTENDQVALKDVLSSKPDDEEKYNQAVSRSAEIPQPDISRPYEKEEPANTTGYNWSPNFSDDPVPIETVTKQGQEQYNPPLTVPLPGPAEYTSSMIDPSLKKEAALKTEVTPEEANRRAYKAEKRGLSKGVASGLLAGWWLGKRRGRKAEKSADMLSKKVEHQAATAKQLEVKNQELESKVSKLERVQTEIKNVLVRFKIIEKAEIKTSSTHPEKVPEKLAPKPVTPELKLPEEAEKQPEEVELPEGHRLETSVWHNIEVDDKTGKAVETPVRSYGEAFKSEQRQERLASDAAKAQTAAQVGMTVLASQSGSSSLNVSQPSSQPKTTGHIKVSEEFNKAGRQIISQAASPITWVIAVGIFLLLLITGAF